MPANPLKEWRGQRSTFEAATRLGMTERAYALLESKPWEATIKSNRILKIAEITGIPLEMLVDYITTKREDNGNE